jgi:hypothetical protein
VLLSIQTEGLEHERVSQQGIVRKLKQGVRLSKPVCVEPKGGQTMTRSLAPCSGALAVQWSSENLVSRYPFGCCVKECWSSVLLRRYRELYEKSLTDIRDPKSLENEATLSLPSPAGTDRNTGNELVNLTACLGHIQEVTGKSCDGLWNEVSK